MALKLTDRWVWDSWYVWEEDICHAFYLCASRDLEDPDRRHFNACVGHATSSDLVSWTILPDALSPSGHPHFDSLATWTGSVVKGPDGQWWMFYTGVSREDGGDVQKIGAATSSDLLSWEKRSDVPPLVADGRWYETLDKAVWHQEAWRDPWVFKKTDGTWQMLVTARAKQGDPRTRGAIGQAVSTDLKNWVVGEPLAVSQGDFGQLEVLQYEVVDGVPIILFCCGYRELSEARRATFGEYDATYSLACNRDFSDLDLARARPFDHQLLYASRLVRGKDGSWFLLGFRNIEGGQFIGEISDPIPVTAKPDVGLVPRL